MTIVRFSHKVESSNLGRDDVDDLIKITSNRAQTVPIGGFADNWSDEGPSNTNNITQTPFKLHWYSVKIWTTGPVVMWSSDIEQYRMVQLGSSADTSFTQFNIANDTVKKYTLTNGGKTWSRLGKAFVRRVGNEFKGRPRKYNNAQFKLQVQNIDPNTTPQDIAYYAIIQGKMEYDAV